MSEIVETMRSASGLGGFVKQVKPTGRWVAVGDDIAREKVGQLLREAMTRKNPVKLQSRKEQRKLRAMNKRAGASITNVKRDSDCSTCTEKTSDMTSCSSSLRSDSNSTNSLIGVPTQVLSIPPPESVISFATTPLPLDAESSTAFPSSFEDFNF